MESLFELEAVHQRWHAHGRMTTMYFRSYNSDFRAVRIRETVLI